MRVGKRHILGDLDVDNLTNASALKAIHDNIMVNAFYIAINGSLSQHGMVDGSIDEYEDESGIDTGSSTNEAYDSSLDCYSPSGGGIDSNTKLLLNGNNENPVGQNVAGYFDGSDDYLTVPDHADWDIFAQTNFTVDFWVKHNTISLDNTYLEQYESNGENYWFLHRVGNGLMMILRTGATNVVVLFGGEITDHNWHHVAFIKIGNEYGIYKDGVQVAYVSDSDTASFTGTLYIGTRYFSSTYQSYMNGYLDEMRIYHGNPFSASPNSGLTDTISVPTFAHIKDSNTKLLLHYNNINSTTFTDSGNTGHTVTSNGGAIQKAVIHDSEPTPKYPLANNEVSIFSKVFNQCGYFVSSSDYLTVPDHADFDIVTLTNFTVDFWAKLSTIGTYQYLMGHGSNSDNEWVIEKMNNHEISFRVFSGGGTVINCVSSSNIFNDYNWHHIVAIKVGNDYGVYFDGKQVAYATNSNSYNFTGSLYIGSDTQGATWGMMGYLDEVRIYHGNPFSASPDSGLTDTISIPTSAYVSDSNTKLLLHMDGTDNSTTFTDSGNTGHTATAQGNAKIFNPSILGTGSIKLDGVDDYISISDSADWSFGTGDFTIDFWIKFNVLSANQQIIGQYEDINNRWRVGIDSSNKFYFLFMNDSSTLGSYIMTSAWTGSVNTWYHIAVVRNGTTGKLFIDGVSQTLTETTAFGNNDVGDMVASLQIGVYAGSTQYLNGYLSDFRISKGIARWTSNFTPPTIQYSITKDNMTLISNSNTADSAPDGARLIIFEEDIDSITLNTDLKAYVSRDGGTTWSQIILEDVGDYATGKDILAGSINISGQPSGTSMKYKIETLNGKNLKLHGISLLWD